MKQMTAYYIHSTGITFHHDQTVPLARETTLSQNVLIVSRLFVFFLRISGSTSHLYVLQIMSQFLNTHNSAIILGNTSLVTYGHLYAPSSIAPTRIDFIAIKKSGTTTSYNTIEGNGPVRRHLALQLSLVTQTAFVRIYQYITQIYHWRWR